MVPESLQIFPPAFDPGTAYGIGSIAVLVAAAWVVLFARRSYQRGGVLAAGALVVMLTSAAAAHSGLLARFDVRPPPMLIMIASVMAGSLAIGLSRFGRDSATALSFAALVGLQSFRLPLELVMHHAGNIGIMPTQLSFSGYNFDIVTGTTALLLFVLLRGGVRIPGYVLWAWNLWGIWCLGVIMIIAITTSPLVRAFGDDPRDLNTWVLYHPYVWLPVVLVTVAISSHVIVTRKLLSLSLMASPARRGARPESAGVADDL